MPDVGLHGCEWPGIAIVDRLGRGLPLREVPDSPLAVFDHLAQLGKLGREVHHAERGLAAAVDVAAVDGPVVVEELEVFLLNRRVELAQIGRRRLGRRAEDRVHHDRCEPLVAEVAQMNPVD